MRGLLPFTQRLAYAVAFGAVSVTLVACGSKGKHVHEHAVHATARMRVVKVTGTTQVETGTTSGSLHARLTLTIDRKTGEAEFTAITPRGLLAGVARLQDYEVKFAGATELFDFRAKGTVDAGTGLFSHVTSRSLIMRGTTTRSKEGARQNISVDGRLYY